jgi:hypothetical protein
MVPGTSRASRPGHGRAGHDLGSATLGLVLLTPVFVVIAFAAFQAAMWSHARTEARAVARDTAVQVARHGVAADDAIESASQVLRADTDLAQPHVTVVNVADLVTVTVTGRAPGIIRGTSADVEIVEAVPVERFRATP